MVAGKNIVAIRHGERKASEVPTAQELMAMAVARRDELNVFIKLLLETFDEQHASWAAAEGRREIPDTSDSGKHISRGRGGGVAAPAYLVAQKEDRMTHEQQADLVAEARRIVRGETMMIDTTQHVRACLLLLDEVQARLYSYEQFYPNPMQEAAVQDG